MNKLLLIIFATVLFLPQLSFAEDEVIWETDVIGGLNEVEVSPLGEVLYNTNDSIIEVRNITDGKLIDKIIFTNTTRLDQISISADGRYMAVSGETKFVIIYDLFEKREVKRITTVAYEREEYDKNVVYNAEEWISSSISPDGTKITGVVIHKDYDKTNFVVIDIESEKVLFEQRRITYDYFNPSPESFKWMSAEYSPDGNYIVAQLDFHIGENNDASDSVYIYNAKTLELYDVVLNTYSKSNNDIASSKFESIIGVASGSNLLIYNLNNKRIEIKKFESYTNRVVFSRVGNEVILRVGPSKPFIYDYQNSIFLYEYPYYASPRKVTLDNKYFICIGNNQLKLIEAKWNSKTSIETEKGKNIISPNPSSGLLNIDLRNQSISQFHYSIVSSSGQIVISNELGILQPNANNLSIDISSISSGHYILRIFSEREEFEFNIIKEN